MAGKRFSETINQSTGVPVKTYWQKCMVCFSHSLFRERLLFATAIPRHQLCVVESPVSARQNDLVGSPGDVGPKSLVIQWTWTASTNLWNLISFLHVFTSSFEILSGIIPRNLRFVYICVVQFSVTFLQPSNLFGQILVVWWRGCDIWWLTLGRSWPTGKADWEMMGICKSTGIMWWLWWLILGNNHGKWWI